MGGFLKQPKTKGYTIKMKNLKFEELNLSKDLQKAIADMGFKEATPIQSQAIPKVLEGYDIIGQASTGTGKTAAFALPAIEKIDSNSREVQVLVLCPTRELAIQVAVETNKFLKYKKNISALAIYGGQPIERQFFKLEKRPQIIIGTPGRTLDHLERGTLNFGQVRLAVLDEADEMMDMGFRQDIEKILKAVNKKRQTILFSATMSHDILHLTKRYQKNPTMIKVAPEKLSVQPIKQIYFDVDISKKTPSLMKLIDNYNPKLSIVFCNTRRKVDVVARKLRNQRYRAEGIHGNIRQNKRDAIMSKFRSNKIKILVATDVAARGIDVANVSAVFNFEIPKDAKSYVHRIGRTGRAGKTGIALSLVSRREVALFRDIQRFTKFTITKQSLQSKKIEPCKKVKPFLQNASRNLEAPKSPY